jgi:transposase
MRPLKSHFPAHALPTVETVLKQPQEARGLRRAQAGRAVGAGPQVNTVSTTFHGANAALSKWGQRFAPEGPRGLLARRRSGRPPKGTCALAQPRNRLVDQAPLEHGALHAPWRCRALAPVLAQQPGVPRGRASLRCA